MSKIASPKVSVILTVYKRTQYIAEALQGVFNQTFTDFEIIIADDSCNSEIEDIVSSFQDERCIYQGNPETLGVVLNIKKAMRTASGKYIAILNDDDAWEPDFLQALVLPLDEDSRFALAFSDHWIMLSDGKLDRSQTEFNTIHYGRKNLPKGKVTNLDLFVLEKNGVPLAMASVFRKDALNIHLLEKEVAGAYDFWTSCLLAATGRFAYYIPRRLTRYRLHGEMETARKASDKLDNMVYIFRRLLDLGLFPERTDLLKTKYSRALFQAGKNRLCFHQRKTAQQYFFKSLRHKFTFKATAGLVTCYLPKKLRNRLISYLNEKT